MQARALDAELVAAAPGPGVVGPAPAPLDHAMPIGVVVIGRNEGERLKQCLRSVAALAAGSGAGGRAGAGAAAAGGGEDGIAHIGGTRRTAGRTRIGAIVYVDSGSTDGSAEWARANGATVVALDARRLFSAARARNEGFEALRRAQPGVALVQFVDGDCELVDGWLHTAAGFLQAHAEVAVVCGRLRERHPERSVYNRLCELEWDRPAGEVRACGGLFMVRAGAFAAVSGFREDMVAGEEPELCLRLRARGHKVWRLARTMAWHDAAMLRFWQWWTRTSRSGHASAQGDWLHRGAPERPFRAEWRRALAWGVALPAAMLLLLPLSPWALLLAAAYPLQVLRLALRDGIGDAGRRWRALFYVLGRFPEAQGVLRFHRLRLAGRQSRPIEYK